MIAMFRNIFSCLHSCPFTPKKINNMITDWRPVCQVCGQSAIPLAFDNLIYSCFCKGIRFVSVLFFDPLISASVRVFQYYYKLVSAILSASVPFLHSRKINGGDFCTDSDIGIIWFLQTVSANESV